MKKIKRMEYSKPDTHGGCWEYDAVMAEDSDPMSEIDGLTLMRSNRPNKNGMRQMITALEAYMVQDHVGCNNLRLILSAPLMYEVLADLRDAMKEKAKNEICAATDSRLPIPADLSDKIMNALSAAEEYGLPFDDETKA